MQVHRAYGGQLVVQAVSCGVVCCALGVAGSIVVPSESWVVLFGAGAMAGKPDFKDETAFAGFSWHSRDPAVFAASRPM